MNNPAIGFEDKYTSFSCDFRESDTVYLRISGYESSTLKTVSSNRGISETRALTVLKDFVVTGGGVSGDTYPGSTLTEKYIGPVSYYNSLGNSNIYSLALHSYSTSDQVCVYNIPDISVFLCQFPRLYSFYVNIYRYSSPLAMPIIKGDFGLIPKYIHRLHIHNYNVIGNNNVTNQLLLNINNYPTDSELEFLALEGPTGNSLNVLISGDLKKLPPNLSYFKITLFSTSSTVTYSGGRVFPNVTDTFYFNRVLTSIEIDMLLNDMASSITSAIGGKVIYLRGTRTSASDSAVTYLQGLGFTVTITA